MTKSIEFFFDFRSPYSYLAHTQLAGLGAQVILRPMAVLKVMEMVGNVPTTLVCAAKGRYARADLGRWAKRYGIPLRPSDMRANDGDACSRAVLAAGTAGDAATVTAALFRAGWGEAKPLTSVSEILGVVSSTGADVNTIAARIDDPQVIAALEANTKEAAERGVFGSPTILVDTPPKTPPCQDSALRWSPCC